MQDAIQISRVVRFETFELNLKTGELRKGGVKIRLPEQSFQILAALLERPGKLITREALRERLWPDGTFVDFEKSLNSAVVRLRQALGDSADEPRFIETLPRRGYRFIGPVELLDSAGQVVGLPEGAGDERVVAHYRLLEKLGEGGMGVVYKALDTKLNRPVALKFLAQRLTLDPEAKKRFRREARAAAAVDHPNICTVHEIDEVDGQIFIAMAYIEGPSLDKKIGGSPLPLDEAFDIAAPTAQGLQAAHEKGVVHRDIKSANILLTADGQVKIVDFGLAQLADPEHLTKTGTTLGTPAYMSPEQARWEKVDRRTDIWSLGVVLYEMVGGRLPFRGDVRQAMMHSILHADPDPLTALRTGLPIELDYLIDKALAKERDERYQHVDEVLVDLRGLQKEQSSGMDPARTTPGTTRPRLRGRQKKSTKARVATAAAVVLTIAGAAFWNFLPTAEPPVEPMRPVPLTSYPGFDTVGSFSPDGSLVVFGWNGEKQDNSDIYVKAVGQDPPLRLTTDPAMDAGAAWSPDGRWIAFLRGHPPAGKKMGLYLIPPLGGTERKLAETRVPFTYSMGTCLAWSPDSAWLAVCDWEEDSPGRLSVFLLSVDSGERRRLTWPPEDSIIGDVLPAFSPDGRTLAFSRYGSGIKTDLYLLDLDEDLNPQGEPRRRTFMERLMAGHGFTSDGRDIVFAAGSSTTSSLWRVPVSGTASPERLPFGENGFWPHLSRQGNRLAYTVVNWNGNIYRLNLPVADGPTGTAVKFISSSRWDTAPDYSPDGNRIAFASNRSGASEIWTCDSEGSNPVQLTSLGAESYGPRWAPDGKSIGFNSDAEGHFDVYVVDAEGGAPRRLTSDPSYEWLPSWSRDGEWIYFWSDRNEFAQIFRIPAGGGPAQVVTAGRGPTMESPDGRWFYFARGANHSVWRMPVEGGGEEDAEQVLESTHEGSYEVVEDGVYFVPPSKGNDFSLQFLRFATGAVEPIHDIERQPFGTVSVAPDGRSILFGQHEPLEADIMLVENFR